MGQAKQRLMEEEFEQEQAKQNKLDGYRKVLMAKGIYAMDCPYCNGPWSFADSKLADCIHCNQAIEMNKDD